MPKKVKVKELFKGLEIDGALHESRPQGVAKEQRVDDTDELERAERVHVFSQRHPHTVAPQDGGEFDDSIFHSLIETNES